MHKTSHILGALTLVLSMQQTNAADSPFIDETDDTVGKGFVGEEEWKEGQFSLPGPYQAKDLQQFQLEKNDNRFEYFIDRSSLQTGKDGVTRFILVIRSKRGVDNSSYEGIRCGERKYTVYAYGSKQGFKRLTNPTWRSIPRTGYESYRDTLYNNLLCSLTTGKANRPEAVIDAMQLNTTVADNPLNQN